MDSGGLLDIVFFAMIAGFVALRLYSVLGKRTGHERRAEPQSAAGQSPSQPQTGPTQDPLAELHVHEDSALGQGLNAISAADHDFDPINFVEGAGHAYAMIVESFAQGDVDTLHGLLAPDVFDSFKAAIDERADAGEEMDTRVDRVVEAELREAALQGKQAEISVRITADVISVTRDNEGRVIDGDPHDAERVHDIWTFQRRVGASDPSWLLVATDSDD